MIASVRGRVAALLPESAVIELGGVGLRVQCVPETLSALRVGDDAVLATSLVVREDSLTLFGFAEPAERDLFELLQTASGVGPRLAQAMLAVHGPADLRRAIREEDLARLCAVPGIGRKGAQRIVLELKDRVGVAEAVSSARAQSADADGDWRVDVRAGLVGLGWSAREADQAVDAVAPLAAGSADEEPMTTAALLRAALQTLART